LRVDAAGKNLTAEARDAFFEFVSYPVHCAALANEKFPRARERATRAGRNPAAHGVYNNQIAGGKWHFMMSDNPRGQLSFTAPKISTESNLSFATLTNSEVSSNFTKVNSSGADLLNGITA